MKKERLFLLILGLFVFNLSFAQRGGGDRAAMEERRKAQFEKMVAAVDLSEDQATEIKSINKEYMDKMRAMRRDADGSREGMRETMMKLRKEQKGEIKDILTAEQFVKYEKFEEEQRANRPQQRGRRGEGRRTQGS